MIASRNPATGELLARYEPHTSQDVEARLEGAWRRQGAWRRTSFAERSALLLRAAALLRQDPDGHARTITLEMGKPIAEARAEVLKCAATLEHYAEHAAGYLADDVTPSDASDSRVVFEPLGTIYAIMPWNYPYWQFFRFAAPALMAGNAVILKHASNVPGCALALERLMLAAGAPDGLVSVVLLEGGTASAIVDDRRVAAVTLTGSTEVGRLVAARAGAALKKCVLELGGSDPFIVLADADLPAAARAAASSRFTNTGQSCVNAKRFLVEEAIADDFTRLLVEEVGQLRAGDPFDSANALGPLALPAIRDALDAQVSDSIRAGARLLLGGAAPDSPGWYYPATLLDRVVPGMRVFDEEVFGPAGAIVRVRDEDQAVELANQTEFGLGGAVWTGDAERGTAVARKLETGAVFVNGITASQPGLPFGGVKASGYGRELGSYGIKEFTNAKTLWVGPRRAQ
jgi:succinate-semialdehyde dehydrogenase/glutarate-semialdehyde dehydrogenase